MTTRPHVDRLSIWDCDELEVRRDTDNECIDIICRGADDYARLHISIWNGDMKTPVLKIEQTLIDPPTTRETITEILNESLAKHAFRHEEDMGSEG